MVNETTQKVEGVSTLINLQEYFIAFNLMKYWGL
jgi:hypothetical protein